MNRRVKQWLAGIFLVLAISFITLKIIVAVWLYPVVETILNEAVGRYTDGLYAVQYDRLQIKPLQRKIEITGFRLWYDSSRVAAEAQLQQRIFVRATAQQVTLAIHELQELFFRDYLHVEEVTLVAPSVALHNYSSEFHKPEGKFDAYRLVSPYFDSVRLDYVNISEASFEIHNVSGKPFQDFLVAHMQASVSNLVVNARTAHRNLGYPQADQFTLMVNNACYLLPDSLHDVTVGTALFDPIRETIQLSEVVLLPKADKHAFARSLGYQKEWIHARIALLSMQDINLHRLIAENTLSVGRLALDSASIEVYRDRSVPRRKAIVKQKPLVVKSLQNLTVPFVFDTITVAQAQVLYEEQVAASSEPGNISFEEVYASFYHVTNMDRTPDAVMQADIQAQLMGESQMRVHIDFPLNRSDDWHHVRGELAEFPLQKINPMIEPTAFASVQSGTGHHLSFEMDVDEQKAIGKIMFEYSDLKVALLNKSDPEHDPTLKHKIGSVLANWFVVKTDNLPEKEPIREGIIAYEHPGGGSVFSYWSQALLTGLKMSVGLEKEPAFLVAPDTTQGAEAKPPGFLKRLLKKDTPPQQ